MMGHLGWDKLENGIVDASLQDFFKGWDFSLVWKAWQVIEVLDSYRLGRICGIAITPPRTDDSEDIAL